MNRDKKFFYIYEKTIKLIRYHIKKSFIHEQDRRDVEQEIFIKILQDIKRIPLKNEDHMKGVVSEIARFGIYNYYRAIRNKFASFKMPYPENIEKLDRYKYYEYNYSNKEMLEIVSRFLEEIDDKDANIFIDKVLFGCNYNEIEEKYNCNYNEIRYIVKIVKEKIRKSVDKLR